MPDELEKLLVQLDPFYRFAQAFALAFGALLVLQLARRLLAGASLTQLWHDRFYECPPIRGVLWTVIGTLWLLFLIALGYTLRTGTLAVQLYQRGQAVDVSLAVWTVVGLVVVVALFVIRRRFQRAVTKMRPVPPEVFVNVQGVSEGISPRLLARLGAESFPNHVARTWRLGLWTRRLARLAFILTALYLVLVYAVERLELQRQIPAPWNAYVLSLATFQAYADSVKPLLQSWLTPLQLASAGYLGLMLFLVFRNENRHYLLLKAPDHWTLLLTGGLAPVLAVLGFFGSLPALGALALLLFLLSARLGRDLKLARNYRARARIIKPIVAEIRRQCSFLARLPTELSGDYAAIDPKELTLRITRGTKNLEEAGPLVTRHYGRYLRLAEVQHERCAVAAMQFLTVARSTSLGRWWSTSKWLHNPVVPVWDLAQFPLYPPEGYQSVNHQDELAAEWNVIATCGGGCNGTGIVYVTETYQESETRYDTEYVNGQSRSVLRTVYVTKTRQVQRTCTTCGGTGRLEHVQNLHTSWRHLNCRATEPALPMPELTEGAEEVTFFEMPYLEAMQPVPPGKYASSMIPTLTGEVELAASQLTKVGAQHTPAVLKILDGDYVYRARFAVHGFHTISISFGKLLGRRGWFFGRRPEFHFPSLPLSWSMVGTRILLPPALLWLAYWYCMLALRWVGPQL